MIEICIEHFAQMLPWSEREKGPGERGTDKEGEVRTILGTVSSAVSLACRDAVCPLPLSPEQNRKSLFVDDLLPLKQSAL